MSRCTRSHFVHRRSCRRGYVLVVTLGLLVLSTTLLVAVGRVAVYHALQARLAADELQRRWGTVSCRVAVLPFAEQILADAEARTNAPVAAYRANILLGGQRFRLIVSDEQAKANVNSLLDSSDKSTAENRIRAGLSGSGLSNAIRIYPASLTDVRSHSPPSATQSADALPAVQWVTGLGQIFDGVPPERLIASNGFAPTDSITCWGSGSINVMRASESSLRIGAGPPLTMLQIDRLISARDDLFKPRESQRGLPSLQTVGNAVPNLANLDPVSRLLAVSRIQVKNRARLPLITGSTCHSVWVVVQDTRRSWYQLFVLDESDFRHPHTDSYVW